MRYVGGIDAGGTSWRCAIAQDDNRIMARTAFATTSPQETLGNAIAFFSAQAALGLPIDRIGIGCFGPVVLNPSDPNWGHILATPKAGWADADIAGTIKRGMGCDVVLETDVTAAAFAEQAWGAGQGMNDLAYVTVGTGIGAGILLGGKPIRGALHPEVGHMRVPRHRDDLDFPGVCSFHGDCVEGLASAPALKARWGIEASALPDDHIAWEIEAHYLAHVAVNIILTTAIQRVIFGGGVSVRTGLIGRVSDKAKALIGPYGLAGPGQAGFSIVQARLGLESGLLGGLWLAQNTP